MSKKTEKKVQDDLMNELNNLEGKSSKIRYLDSKGFSRSKIVEIMSDLYGKPIRYQHVRNVLVTQLNKDLVKK